MKKILLIEDDLVTIELYEAVFKKAGFDIETITTATEGLERLKEIKQGKKEKPRLILLDLLLPDTNGNSILKQAKSWSETKDILIFVLTNYTNPKLTKELLKQGADKFLVKTDYNPSELLDIVKQSLK